MLKKFSFIISFFLLYLISYSAKISGKVIDENDLPIPNALIIVEEINLIFTCNPQGEFDFFIPIGNYAFQIKKINYKSLNIKLSVNLKINNFTLRLEKIKTNEPTLNEQNIFSNNVRNILINHKFYNSSTHSKLQQLTSIHFKKSSIKKIINHSFNRAIVQWINTTIDSLSTQIIFSNLNPDISNNNKSKLLTEYNQNTIWSNFNPIDFSHESVKIPIVPNINFRSPIAENNFNYYDYTLETIYVENNEEIYKIKVKTTNDKNSGFYGYLFVNMPKLAIVSLELFIAQNEQPILSNYFLDTVSIVQYFSEINKSYTLVYQELGASGDLWKLEYEVNNQITLDDKQNTNHFIPINKSDSILLDKQWDSIQKDSLKLQELIQSNQWLIKKNKLSPIFPLQLLFTGKSFIYPKNNLKLNLEPFVQGFNINPIEGFNTSFHYTLSKHWPNEQVFYVQLKARYGFNNRHFNPSLKFYFLNIEKKRIESQLNFGKKIVQFNPNNPVNERTNDFYYLIDRLNYLKIYESYFIETFNHFAVKKNLFFQSKLLIEKRIPLNNLAHFPLIGYTQRIKPNYPIELTQQQFIQHQAVILQLKISYDLNRNNFNNKNEIKYNLSSYPILSWEITQGLPQIFNSKINYNKWQFQVDYNLNFNRKGNIKINYNIGGFTYFKNVEIQDYTHYNTNQFIFSDKNFNYFQALPFYSFSNTRNFYLTCFNEYKLPNLLTNNVKIFKKWNWSFLLNYNALFLTTNRYYNEFSFGIENIFKVLNLVFVYGQDQDHNTYSGIRFKAHFFN